MFSYFFPSIPGQCFGVYQKYTILRVVNSPEDLRRKLESNINSVVNYTHTHKYVCVCVYGHWNHTSNTEKG